MAAYPRAYCPALHARAYRGVKSDLRPERLEPPPPSTGAPSSVRPCSLRRLIRQLPPPGDDAHALAGLGVVGDEREVPAELDDARQLAAFVVSAADRFGGGLVRGEHAAPRLGR